MARFGVNIARAIDEAQEAARQADDAEQAEQDVG
jgi:hypothetical protein